MSHTVGVRRFPSPLQRKSTHKSIEISKRSANLHSCETSTIIAVQWWFRSARPHPPVVWPFRTAPAPVRWSKWATRSHSLVHCCYYCYCWNYCYSRWCWLPLALPTTAGCDYYCWKDCALQCSNSASETGRERPDCGTSSPRLR